MRCLVTGAAGFIGSHLCERLLELGHDVTGLDAFTSYYARPVKERNLLGARSHPRFTFHSLDLRYDPLDWVFEGIDAVFHLAATPGLVRSWTDFDSYLSNNVVGTQRLLDTLCGRRGGPRLIYASTSSVYGLHASGNENTPTHPASPYGVTKLAAEHLCRAYGERSGLEVVILRYFSVYGPRQRPDMGYHRFIRALLTGEPITVYGDGQQVRGNTYVADCVAATVAALGGEASSVYNVGGGESASVWDILRRLERLTGRRAVVRQEPARAGDQRETFADTSRLHRHLGWRPRTTLDEGLARQWEWQQLEHARTAPSGCPAPLLTAAGVSS
jgi:nucleoside-diphosphate-sugar epimerase